ncbi:MAG: phosphatase PAP2 family protein [Anaerolineae bacterium]
MAERNNVRYVEPIQDRSVDTPEAMPVEPVHRRRDLDGGLQAPGWLATHPAVGLSLFLLGLVVFGFLAYQLQSNGPMVQLDQEVGSMMQGIASKAPGMLLEFMTYGFFMGKENLQVLGAILVVYFLYKRYWPELGMVLIGWTGGTVVWTLLINYFNRPRPDKQLGIEVKTIPSFPSGHTMFAILALGLLAYLLVPKMPSLFWKWVIVLAAVLTMLFVGFTRLYEGGHFLSDLIAGYAVGLSWGALVYTLLDGVALRRRTHHG